MTGRTSSLFDFEEPAKPERKKERKPRAKKTGEERARPTIKSIIEANRTVKYALILTASPMADRRLKTMLDLALAEPKVNIRTGRFLLHGEHPGAVSLTPSAPTWYKGVRYKPIQFPVQTNRDRVKPPAEMAEWYSRMVLGKHDPEQVVDDLKNMVGPEIVLLTHERPGHTIMLDEVVKWLNSAGLGLNAEPLPTPTFKEFRKSRCKTCTRTCERGKKDAKNCYRIIVEEKW